MGFVALFSVILLLFSSLVLSSLGKLLDSLWPEPIAEFTLYLCSCRNKSEIWKGGSVWTTRTEQYNLWFGDTWSQWWKQQWQFYATGHKIMGSKSNSCLTKKSQKEFGLCPSWYEELWLIDLVTFLEKWRSAGRLLPAYFGFSFLLCQKVIYGNSQKRIVAKLSQTYLSLVILSHFEPQRALLLQGRCCNRFCFFFWQSDCYINVFFKRHLAERAVEIVTNITSKFYKDILRAKKGVDWL